MSASELKLRQQQVTSWVMQIKAKPSKVLVSNYCYNCFFTGDKKMKTIIIFPDEVVRKGIISINKPLEEIEFQDIIMLYKRINCSA